MANLAQDTFNRSDQSDWGTASDGVNTWSVLRGTSTFSISSNKGAVANNSGSYCVTQCGSTTSADTDQVVSIKRANSSDLGGLVARVGDANNWYAITLGEYASNLAFSKFVAGSYTSGVAFGPSTTFAVGTTWNVRFRCVGTSIKARAWDASTSEPSTWDIDTTDSSLSGAKGFGIIADPFTGTAMTFDDYLATDSTTTATSSRTITNEAVLLATRSRTVQGNAVLLATRSRTIQDEAVLLATRARTITNEAVLQATYTRTVQGEAVLLETKTRTVQGAAVLQTTSTRTIQGEAVLQVTRSRTVTSEAALQTTRTRTVSGESVLSRSNSRTISGEAVLLASRSRAMPGEAVLIATRTRTVSGHAVLSGTVHSHPNCTVIVRSGRATAIVRSGEATAIIRS